jgi:hypothetical protein
MDSVWEEKSLPVSVVLTKPVVVFSPQSAASKSVWGVDGIIYLIKSTMHKGERGGMERRNGRLGGDG